MNFWSIVIGVALSFSALALFIFVLYRLVIWARRRNNGAYLFAAAVAPFIAMGNVSDPDFRIVLEAKELKKREEDDAGAPPHNTDDEERAGPRRYSGTRVNPEGGGKAKKKRRLRAMSKERRQRPALVRAISIVIGLVAITHLSVQSLPFAAGSSASILSVLANAVASTPVLDRTMLFILSATLLTSMVLFFRMRKASFLWFAGYLGLGSVAVIRCALTSVREPWFNGPVSLIGIAVTAVIFAYMWRLKRRQLLA